MKSSKMSVKHFVEITGFFCDSVNATSNSILNSFRWLAMANDGQRSPALASGLRWPSLASAC